MLLKVQEMLISNLQEVKRMHKMAINNQANSCQPQEGSKIMEIKVLQEKIVIWM